VKKVKQPHGGEINRFEPGESGNPYGRPTKLVSQVLKDLKEAGAEAVSPGQVSDVITVLLNLPVEMVKKIAEDKKLPILIQRTARRFAGSSDKDWDWVLSNNLDRAHGKSKQSVEHTGKNGEAIKMDFSRLSTEELREMSKMRKKAMANGDTKPNTSNGR
jgi:hypothetical protein